jgi:hypothetical protein
LKTDVVKSKIDINCIGSLPHSLATAASNIIV